MISHAAMAEATRMLSCETGIVPTDKALIVMPLFHLGGKIEQMNFSLMVRPSFSKPRSTPTIFSPPSSGKKSPPGILRR